MTLKLVRISFPFVCIVSVFIGVRSTEADDYVWARSNWGAMPTGNTLSSMSNGYGGYYVRRSSPGNNHEGHRITNPNGFVVPAQSNICPIPQPQTRQHRHFFAASAPPQTTTPAITASNVHPVNPAKQPLEAAPALTTSITPVSTPSQISQQPYRLTRIATNPVR